MHIKNIYTVNKEGVKKPIELSQIKHLVISEILRTYQNINLSLQLSKCENIFVC